MRVLLVGDSAVVADHVSAAADADPGITITLRVPDGIAAVSALRRQAFDAVVMDIGDPPLNAKVTLSRMFKVDPDIKVVTVASLSFANVKASMTALMEGAAEFIPAPAAHTGAADAAAFADSLTAVIRAFGLSPRTAQARTMPVW
ncbi:MAG: hypothetical protein VW405_22605, partial [Rhodospirillaceae bacterium]